MAPFQRFSYRDRGMTEDCLDAQADCAALGKLLTGQCRTEIGIVGFDKRQSLSAHDRGIAADAGFATGSDGRTAPLQRAWAR